MNREETSTIETREYTHEYTYKDLANFAESWAEANDMDADMMQGILQMGINAYENSYTAYSLAMQAYSNHEAKQKEGS